MLLVMGSESHGRGQHRPEDAAYFPDGRSVVVPDAGHWAHHDQPGAVVAAIRSFFAEVGSPHYVRSEEPL